MPDSKNFRFVPPGLFDSAAMRGLSSDTVRYAYLAIILADDDEDRGLRDQIMARTQCRDAPGAAAILLELLDAGLLFPRGIDRLAAWEAPDA